MTSTDNYTEVIEVFLKQLPDPVTSNLSTIKNEFLFNGEKVELTAQKVKGFTGMSWNVVSVKNFKENNN